MGGSTSTLLVDSLGIDGRLVDIGALKLVGPLIDNDSEVKYGKTSDVTES